MFADLAPVPVPLLPERRVSLHVARHLRLERLLHVPEARQARLVLVGAGAERGARLLQLGGLLRHVELERAGNEGRERAKIGVNSR